MTLASKVEKHGTDLAVTSGNLMIDFAVVLPVVWCWSCQVNYLE